MATILSRWLNEEFGLSKNVNNTSLEKDFSNGYLLGELFANHFGWIDRDVFSQKFQNSSSQEAALTNFFHIAKAMKTHSINFDRQIMSQIITEQRGAAIAVLLAVKDKYAQETLPEKEAKKRALMAATATKKGGAAPPTTKTARPKDFSRKPKVDFGQDDFLERLAETVDPENFNQIDMAIHLRKFDDFQREQEKKQLEKEGQEAAAFASLKELRYKQKNEKEAERRAFNRAWDQDRKEKWQETQQQWKKHEQWLLQFELAEIAKERAKETNNRARALKAQTEGIEWFERNMKRIGVGASKQDAPSGGVMKPTKESGMAYLQRVEKKAHGHKEAAASETQELVAGLRSKGAVRRRARKERAQRRRRLVVDQARTEEEVAKLRQQEQLLQGLLEGSKAQRATAAKKWEERHQKKAEKRARYHNSREVRKRLEKETVEALERNFAASRAKYDAADAELPFPIIKAKEIAQARREKKRATATAVCVDAATKLADLAVVVSEMQFSQGGQPLLPSAWAALKRQFVSAEPFFVDPEPEDDSEPSEEMMVRAGIQFLEFHQGLGEWKPAYGNKQNKNENQVLEAATKSQNQEEEHASSSLNDREKAQDNSQFQTLEDILEGVKEHLQILCGDSPPEVRPTFSEAASAPEPERELEEPKESSPPGDDVGTESLDESSKEEQHPQKKSLLRISILGKGGSMPDGFTSKLQEWTGLTILSKDQLEAAFSEAPPPEEGLDPNESAFRTCAANLKAFKDDPKKIGLEVPLELRIETLARYLQSQEAAQRFERGWILVDQPSCVNEAKLLEHFLAGYKDDWVKELLGIEDPTSPVPDLKKTKPGGKGDKKKSVPVVAVEDEVKKPNPPHMSALDALFEIKGFEVDVTPESASMAGDSESKMDLDSVASHTSKSMKGEGKSVGSRGTKSRSSKDHRKGNRKDSSSAKSLKAKADHNSPPQATEGPPQGSSEEEEVGLSLKMERLYSTFRGGLHCCRVDRENETDTFALETIHLLCESALKRKTEQEQYDEALAAFTAENERRRKIEEEKKKAQEENEETNGQSSKKGPSDNLKEDSHTKSQGSETPPEVLPPLRPPEPVEGLKRRLEYDLIVRRVERRRAMQPLARLWMEMLTGERHIEFPSLRTLMEQMEKEKIQSQEQSAKSLAVLHGIMVESNSLIRREMYDFTQMLRSKDSRWSDILSQVRMLVSHQLDEDVLSEELEEVEAELGDIAEERHAEAEAERCRIENRLMEALQELITAASEQLVDLEASERGWLQHALHFVQSFKSLLPQIPLKLETSTMHQTDKNDLKEPELPPIIDGEEDDEARNEALKAEQIRQQILAQYTRRSVYKTLGPEDVGTSPVAIARQKMLEDRLDQFAFEEALLQTNIKKLSENAQATALAECICQAKVLLLEEVSKVRALADISVAESDDKEQPLKHGTKSVEEGDIYLLEVLVAYMIRLRGLCTRFDAFVESCNLVLNAHKETLARMSSERTRLEHSSIFETLSTTKKMVLGGASMSSLPKKMDVEDWVCYTESTEVVADAGPLHLPLDKIHSLSQKLQSVSKSRPMIGAKQFRECLAWMYDEEACAPIWKEAQIVDKICRHLDPNQTDRVYWRRLIHLLVCSHLPALPTLEELKAMGEKVGLRNQLPIRLTQYYFVRSTWYFEFKPEEGDKPEPHYLDPKVALQIKEIYSTAWSEEDGKINFSDLLVTWCAPPLHFLPGRTRHSTVFSEGLYRAFCLLGNNDGENEETKLPALNVKQLEAIFGHRSSPVMVDVQTLTDSIHKDQKVQAQTADGLLLATVTFEQALASPQVKEYILQNGLSLQSLISICLAASGESLID